jgi:hypothetical protein
VLLGANYLIPLDQRQRWNLNFTGAAAAVDYLSGMGQPGNWLTGMGFGILYKTPSLKVMVGYAYGANAIRSNHRGADSIGVLMQLDLEHARSVVSPEEPNRWRGLQRVLGVFND